jgi:hypothetical protein
MRWLLVLGLVGCDQGAIPDCATAAAALVTGGDAEIAMYCVSERWSPAARTCITNARGDGARDKCVESHLTAEQRSELELTSAATRACRGFTNRMCACSDAACAQKVADELTRWAQDRYPVHPPRLTDDETKVLQRLGMRMGKCMAAAMTPRTTP